METVTEVKETDQRVRGYCAYDWGKSAFETSVTTAIFPAWFAYLFAEANGISTKLLGSEWTADAMYSAAVMVGALLVAICAPSLGVIADRRICGGFVFTWPDPRVSFWRFRLISAYQLDGYGPDHVHDGQRWSERRGVLQRLLPHMGEDPDGFHFKQGFWHTSADCSSSFTCHVTCRR